MLGKRFGGRTQEAAARIRELVDEALRKFRAGSEPLRIEVGGETHELAAEEIEVREEPQGELVVETDAGYTIALDPHIDEALRREGWAREIVSRVQRLRRDSGLAVSDRIELRVAAVGEIYDAAKEYERYIAHETLAERIALVKESSALENGEDVELDGSKARIELKKWHQQQSSR